MNARASVLITTVCLACSKPIGDHDDADIDDNIDADSDPEAIPDAHGDGDADGDGDGDADTDIDGDSDSTHDADQDHEVPTIGGADAPEEMIPLALFDPDVDGNLNEWPPLRYRLDTETTALRYGPEQRPALDDAQLLFDLRWTEEALYFAAEMHDDEAVVDSSLVWQDDSVELYVDGDNNDEIPTYDENDHQYTVVRDLRIGDHGELIDAGDHEIRHAVTTHGADFHIELALPWSVLGGTAPYAGRFLGIDVAFNDDDTGDAEETHLVMWLSHPMTELGSPVQDTSLFRDLVLSD